MAIVPGVQALLFICYSREDERWKTRIKQHLEIAADGVFEIWDSGCVSAGDDWRSEIRKHIEAARVAVVLVSADSLTDPAVHDEQLPQLKRRWDGGGIRVCPVVVRRCAWECDSWLGSLQPMLERDAALAAMPEAQQDEWLRRIALELRDFMAAPPAAAESADVRTEVVERHTVPATPPALRIALEPTAALVAPDASRIPVAGTFFVPNVADVAELVSSDTSRALDAVQGHANEGRHDTALQQLQALAADTTRVALVLPQQRARLLRLKAHLLLLSDDVEAQVIESLLDDADNLAPPPSRALRWRLIEQQAGCAAALSRAVDPSTADERTVAARLHLLAEQPAAALEVLKSVAMDLENDAETHRWRALVHLVLGDLAPARLAAERALALEPKHNTVIAVAGIVEYFSAMSGAVLPRRLVEWPHPVSRHLMRSDSDALSRLATAATRFEELARRVSRPDEVGLMAVWRMACLANHPVHAEQAHMLCRQLLAVDPCNVMALFWAAARNWKVDYSASAKALERLVEEGTASATTVLALVALRLRDNKCLAALRLLDDHRALLEGDDHAETWRASRVQALTQAGRLREAAQAAGGDKGTASTSARWIVRLAKAQSSGAFEQYLADAEAEFQMRRNAEPLTHGCFALASRRRVKSSHWTLLASQRLFLETTVGTEAAVRLSARISWELGDFNGCLRTLDERRGVFAGGQLPLELRQVRLACCDRLGLVADALRDAEALVHDSPTLANVLNLVQVRLSLNDVLGAAIAARPLRGRPDLTARQALGVAEAISHVDPDLARALWHTARSRGLSDADVPAALTVGFRLGINGVDLQPVHARLLALAASGKSRAATAIPVDAAITQIQLAQEHAARLNQKYSAAVAPMHVIAAALGVPLAYPYRAWLAEREGGQPQGVLLTAWGGHAARGPLPADQPLIMDT